jgi:hypothetical protein
MFSLSVINNLTLLQTYFILLDFLLDFKTNYE